MNSNDTVTKRYKVMATHTTYVVAYVEAATSEEAWELAINLDGSDFDDSGFGDWDIYSLDEVTND
jgi:hypothetical protein